MIKIIKGIDKKELSKALDELKALQRDALANALDNDVSPSDEAYWRGKSQAFNRSISIIYDIINCK